MKTSNQAPETPPKRKHRVPCLPGLWRRLQDRLNKFLGCAAPPAARKPRGRAAVEPRAQAAASCSSFHHVLQLLLGRLREGAPPLAPDPPPYARAPAWPCAAPAPPPRARGSARLGASGAHRRQTGVRLRTPSPLAAGLRGVAGTQERGKDFPPAPSPLRPRSRPPARALRSRRRQLQ